MTINRLKTTFMVVACSALAGCAATPPTPSVQPGEAISPGSVEITHPGGDVDLVYVPNVVGCDEVCSAIAAVGTEKDDLLVSARLRDGHSEWPADAEVHMTISRGDEPDLKPMRVVLRLAALDGTRSPLEICDPVLTNDGASC